MFKVVIYFIDGCMSGFVSDSFDISDHVGPLKLRVWNTTERIDELAVLPLPSGVDRITVDGEVIWNREAQMPIRRLDYSMEY